MAKARIIFNLKNKGVGDIKIKGTGNDLEKRTVDIGEFVNDGLNKAHIQSVNSGVGTDLSSTDGGITAGQVKIRDYGDGDKLVGMNGSHFQNLDIICENPGEAQKLVRLLHLKHSLVDKKNDGLAAGGDAKFYF